MPTSIIDARDEDLYLVTSHADGTDGGMIVTWITQASMSTKRPRIVAVLSPRNRTTELIVASGRFVVHLLAEEQLDLVPRFGLYSSRDTDKFRALDFGRSAAHIPIVAGTRGHIECALATTVDAGDRLVCIADVTARSPVRADVESLRASTTFSRLPPAIVEALGKKRDATAQRDDEVVIDLRG